jgi:multicomponent Na+:H+ antiporter subunit D
MNLLIILPVLLPAVTASVCLLLWSRPRIQQGAAVAGATALLAAAVWLLAMVWSEGIQSAQAGNWPAPFGISIVADLFSALMVLLACLMGFAVTLYSVAEVDPVRRRVGYFPLLFLLLMGVCGAFLTGDIFNLFVWFEVTLIASFVLLCLGGERQQVEGAFKYVALNLFSSALFLTGVGLLYATAHTLNMADLSRQLPGIAARSPELLYAIVALFAVTFGIKAGVFPLFFWLPASYHTPPSAVSAIFAGLLTKVGVYALARVFTLVFPGHPTIYLLILALAGLTMLTGVLGAVSQFEFRRVLSFHIISQIGYMVMGIGLLAAPDESTRRLGITAMIFYIAHHIIVKTNLFLVAGTVNVLRGTYQLKPLGGLAISRPWLAVLFAIPAFSLAGIPPLSGFWAKLGLIKAGLLAGQYLIVAVALATGLITLLSMIKIWNEAFWKPVPAPPGEEVKTPASPGALRMTLLIGPMALLAGLTLLIGFQPQALFALSQRAAEQMLAPAAYVRLLGLEKTEPAVQDAPAPGNMP